MNVMADAVSNSAFWSDASVWADVVKSFIGAAFGAGFAFATAIYVERRQRRRENLAAGNLALLILSRQVNDFLNVRKAFMDNRTKVHGPHPTAPPWMHFKPSLFSFAKGLRFDYVPLSFLFERGNSQVVNLLSIAETRHTDLEHVVALFTETAAQIQNRLVEFGLTDQATNLVVQDAEANLGPALVAKGNDTSLALLARFEKDEADYVAAVKELRSALLRIYPNADIVKVRPKKEYTKIDWPD